jgi:hypothetical protein
MLDRDSRPAPPALAAPAQRPKAGGEHGHTLIANPVWQQLATGARGDCDAVVEALVRLRMAYAGIVGLDLSQSPPSLDPGQLLESLLEEKFVSRHAGAESRTAAGNAILARKAAVAIVQRFDRLAQAQGLPRVAQAPGIAAAVECLADVTARLFDAIDQDARLREEFKKRRAPGKPQEAEPPPAPSPVSKPPGTTEVGGT